MLLVSKLRLSGGGEPQPGSRTLQQEHGELIVPRTARAKIELGSGRFLSHHQEAFSLALTHASPATFPKRL